MNGRPEKCNKAFSMAFAAANASRGPQVTCISLKGKTQGHTSGLSITAPRWELTTNEPYRSRCRPKAGIDPRLCGIFFCGVYESLFESVRGPRLMGISPKGRSEIRRQNRYLRTKNARRVPPGRHPNVPKVTKQRQAMREKGADKS